MATERENNFYTYAYLRGDGTPYYIGKGKGRRCFMKHGRRIQPPKDKRRILMLKVGLSEKEAFRHEKYMIHVLGRKAEGGLLYNFTDGGEGRSGVPHSDQTREKISRKLKGIRRSEETIRKVALALSGGKIPEETKRKISESSKENYREGFLNPLSKGVEVLFCSGEVLSFSSQTEAGRYLGITPQGVARIIRTGKTRLKIQSIELV